MPSVVPTADTVSAPLSELPDSAGLGPCWACERDLIGGAIFTNPAAVVVIACHPRSSHIHHTPVCPSHTEDVITEHLEHGRHVAVEAPALPEAAPVAA